MPEAMKILGQGQPAANTDAALMTVDADKSQVVSTLVACNTGAAATTFRVHACVAGAGASPANALVYDIDLAAKETIPLTLGITLAETDVLRVRAGTGNVAFTAFGTEIS